MTSPLTIGISILIAAGICIQLAVARHYRSIRQATIDGDDAEDFDRFEKDVEWQLQHELHDAIEEASDGSQEHSPLIGVPHDDQALHITFADAAPAPGSRHDFRAYSRSELERLPDPTASPPHLSQINGFLDHPEEDEEVSYEAPLFVNPKQFHRILKRRMARQVIEEYFRSRMQSENHIEEQRSEHVNPGRKRRPRGLNGRLLNLEEVEQMERAPNGVVVVGA